MSTSGTYTFDSITVDKLILEAFERCGIVGDALTVVQSQSAERSLNLMFSEWVNRGLRLWTVQAGMMTLNQGQSAYNLPANTVNILDLTRAQTTRLNTGGTAYSSEGGTASNAFSGTPNVACTQNDINGYISYNYGSGNTECINYVGIQSNQIRNYTLLIQYSQDNSNWQTALSVPIQEYYKGQIVWFVLPAPTPAMVWRIQETGGSILDIQQIYFNQPSVSNLMTEISRSDYASISNKITQGPPSSYWINRTNQPVLFLWPTPNTTWPTIIYNYMRKIQDINELINNADAPQKFLDAVVAGLAARIALKFAPDRYPTLQAIAEESFSAAAKEDSERTSLKILPNIYGNY